MLKLSTDQSNKLKKIILDYVHGEAISVIKVQLEIESASFKLSCKSLYQKVVLSDKDDLFITAILKSLKIYKNSNRASDRYNKLLNKSNNLFELLENLSHDGNHQINYLLSMIGRTKPPPNWTLVWLITVFSGLTLGLLIYLIRSRFNKLQAWLIQKIPILFNWIHQTFSMVRNIPLLGIAYNSISLILSWINTLANGSITTINKLRRQCFKTLTAGLNIIGYTLSFLAAGIVTIPAAIFYVLGASSEVFHSLFDWYQSHKAYQKLKHYKHKPKYDEPWEVKAEYERAKNLHRRSLNSVWIRISSALLVTAAVGIWSFCPPSLIITICCVVFISLIAITSKSVIWSIKETSARHLQNALKRIHRSEADELCPNALDESKEMPPSRSSHPCKEALLNQWEKNMTQLIHDKNSPYQSTSTVLLKLQRSSPLPTGVEKSALPLTDENQKTENQHHPDDIDSQLTIYPSA